MKVKLRFAGDNIFLVDDELSLADLVLAVSLSVYVEIGDYDLTVKYPKLDRFYKNIIEIPQVPLDFSSFKAFISKLFSIK